MSARIIDAVFSVGAVGLCISYLVKVKVDDIESKIIRIENKQEVMDLRLREVKEMLEKR